jgi:hypothetical protein
MSKLEDTNGLKFIGITMAEKGGKKVFSGQLDLIATEDLTDKRLLGKICELLPNPEPPFPCK